MNIEISDEDYTTYFKYAHWNMEHLFIKYHYTAKESRSEERRVGKECRL